MPRTAALTKATVEAPDDKALLCNKREHGKHQSRKVMGTHSFCGEATEGHLPAQPALQDPQLPEVPQSGVTHEAPTPLKNLQCNDISEQLNLWDSSVQRPPDPSKP